VLQHLAACIGAARVPQQWCERPSTHTHAPRGTNPQRHTPGAHCPARAPQLEREAAAREASLAGAAAEVAGLQDERRAQDAALQQQALELAAYERQVRVAAGGRGVAVWCSRCAACWRCEAQRAAAWPRGRSQDGRACACRMCRWTRWGGSWRAALPAGRRRPRTGRACCRSWPRHSRCVCVCMVDAWCWGGSLSP
jgi:hypothetical protein